MRRNASGRARDGAAAVDPRGHAMKGDGQRFGLVMTARRVCRDEARNRLSHGALNGRLVRDGRVMADLVPVSFPLDMGRALVRTPGKERSIEHVATSSIAVCHMSRCPRAP